MDVERLIVLSGGLPGQRQDYVDWYRDRHLRDMLRIDEVRAGQLCVMPEGEGESGANVAAIYDIAPGSVETLFAEIGMRRGTPAFAGTDTLDRSVTLFSVGRLRTDWTIVDDRPAASEAEAEYRLLLLSAAAPGSPAVDIAPGLRSARRIAWQRYDISAAPFPPPSPFSRLDYAALDSAVPGPLLAEARDALDAAAGEGAALPFLGLFRLIARQDKG